jgi:hypothetical protein
MGMSKGIELSHVSHNGAVIEQTLYFLSLEFLFSPVALLIDRDGGPL